MQHVPVSVINRLLELEWRTPLRYQLIYLRKDFGGYAEVGSWPTYTCVEPGYMHSINFRNYFVELQYKTSRIDWQNLIRSGLDATFAYKKRSCFIAFDRGFLASYVAKLNCLNQVYSKRAAYADGYMLRFPIPLSYGQPTFTLDSYLQSMKLEAREKLYKKLRANYDTFNEGLFVAMARRSIRMIMRPMGAIRDFLHGKVYSAQVQTLRKLRRNKGRKNTHFKRNRVEEAISGTWLEYNFGWNLLLNNLDDAASDLARKNASWGRVRYRERATVTKEKRYIKTSTESVSCASITTDAQLTERVTVYVGATQDINVPDTERLGSVTQARDFIPTIWEVIPFSWMIDYIYPVGGLLDNICYHSALDLKFGYESIKKELIVHGMHPRVFPYQGNTPVVGDPGSIIASIVYFERYALPVDYIKNRTSFTYPDYWKQFLNIAAVTQILNKKAYYLTH